MRNGRRWQNSPTSTPRQQTADSVAKNPGVLAEAEVILSGWGAPTMDGAFLDAAPDLRVVLYGAGSIRRVATPALWDRGVRITSAYAANAVPVSEYTLAAILFSLKRGWHFAFSARREKHYPDEARSPAPTAAPSASSPWAWSAVWYASACGPSTCAWWPTTPT